MSTSYPAHASPRPEYTTQRNRTISEYDLTQSSTSPQPSNAAADIKHPQPTKPTTTTHAHPPLVTPSFTPPLTPNGSQIFDPTTTTYPASSSAADPSSVDPSSTDSPSKPNLSTTASDEEILQSREPLHAASPPPALTPLPTVTCEVRARIPTTTGQEMFLHLYHNSADNKEHLAIVFGPYIRSKSLDAVREGETEKDRMIRGAYVGTLFPGRTSSKRVDALKREAGVGASSGGAKQEGGGLTLPMSPLQAPKRMEGDGEKEGGEVKEAEKKEEELKQEPPFVRIHSECYTGETVWSARCDCGEQLDEAARIMSLSPYGGVIVYLRQEGRGIGLLSKLKAYNLQDLGHDTLQANLLLRHPADARSYGLATAMLVDLGLGGELGSFERERGIRLLTNNPEKVRAVEGPGREVLVRERVGMVPLAWRTGGKEGVRGEEVEKYISTKIEKFKHMFSS